MGHIHESGRDTRASFGRAPGGESPPPRSTPPARFAPGAFSLPGAFRLRAFS